jgi:hypothetical protein
MIWRLFRRKPTPTEAGRALSTRAQQLRRAERDRWVKAHIAQILSTPPSPIGPPPKGRS